MDSTNSGYREIEHTADWMLEVWAPDLAGLLVQAARGMYALSGVQIKDQERRNLIVELDFMDAESLLVRFLGELLYFGEQENLAFDHFKIQVDGTHLSALLEGGQIVQRDKEIKAVTYHGLEVSRTESGLKTRIVFDV